MESTRGIEHGEATRVRAGEHGDDSPVHPVHFYEDGCFPAESIADFLGAGIGAGASALVLATPEHARALTDCLTARVGKLGALRRDRRLVVLDARATLAKIMGEQLPDRARFGTIARALLDGAMASAPSGQVRAFGELTTCLADDGNLAAALALERLCNEVLAARPCRLYCAYPFRHFVNGPLGEAFSEMCNLHDHVAPGHARCMVALQQQARALRAEVAERCQTEARLAEALRRQDEADRRKDQFLAMLGHELRNPLAPILTAVELMEIRGEPESGREREIIRRQARHLARLVNDLLDVSRIVRGSLELHLEATEISAVVANAVEVASPLVERLGHQLTVKVPGTGLPVRGDRLRLSQIFSNLLTNAAKYTRSGGRIAVEARRDDSSAVVEVTDDGCGIRKEMLTRIFEPFVQGGSSFDRSRGGLGLGLALVKAIAEMHGGSVSARSAGPELGSTFSVRLPLHQSTHPSAAPVEPRGAVPDSPARSAGGPGRRLLLVDDDWDVAETLATAFDEAGYQALARAGISPPDVAIIDIGLPAMDGWELGKRLRAAHPTSALRLVAMTGYGQDEDREKSREAGFDLHLVKPVELSALRKAVEG
jgi:signal transduction histidine kinase